MEQDGLKVTILGFEVQSLVDVIIQLYIKYVIVIRRFIVEGRTNVYYILLPWV